MTPSPAQRLWLDAEQCLERRDLTGAEQAYRKALQIEARHVPSLLGLSGVLTMQGTHRTALAAALEAFEAKPSHPALVFGLARKLRHFNEFERLIACLAASSVKAEAPSNVMAQIAMMELSIGEGDEAYRTIDAALHRNPRDAACFYMRGNLHAFHGRIDAADDDYEASLKCDPRLFQAAWMQTSLRTATRDANHVDRLRAQLARAAPGGAGEVYLRFALHKELHDLGDNTAAWDELAAGCAVKRRQVTYKPAAHDALIDALTTTCDEGFIERGSAINPAAVPIFIVGMYRSGTTLVERMLEGHPQVQDAGETYAFAEHMRRATDRAIMDVADAEMVRRAAGADFDQVATGYCDSSRWLAHGKPFFTEKLPVNFLLMGFIAKAVPSAKIVHVRRDALDTCFSNLRTLFSGAAAYSYGLDDLAHYHAGYTRIMEHWRRTMPDRFIEVDYADLVASPESEARRIAAACGLDYVPSMIDVGRSGGMVRTASAMQVRDGIRTDRHAAWEPYAAQLQPLIDALGYRRA